MSSRGAQAGYSAAESTPMFRGFPSYIREESVLKQEIGIIATQQPKRIPRFGGVAFQQLGVRLHRYLQRRLVKPEVAEDLTQEVYLRLLRIQDDRLVRCPEAYVYRIASNLLGEFKLHEQEALIEVDSERVAELADRLEDESSTPDEACEQVNRERWLEEVLAQLPPMQRAVFLLAKREDLSYGQIADRLQLSVHTVKKYLFRAMDHCRKAIQQRPGAEDKR